jgi:hypothetical protein
VLYELWGFFEGWFEEVSVPLKCPEEFLQVEWVDMQLWDIGALRDIDNVVFKVPQGLLGNIVNSVIFSCEISVVEMDELAEALLSVKHL